MTCEYIYIFKGDDTDWNNEQFLTINVTGESGVDLSTMTATFSLGSIVKKDISLASGSFQIALSAQDTAGLVEGNLFGSIQIFDEQGRVKTACNTIPFYVTNNVIVEQNQQIDIDLPQGSPVSINLSVGGTVSYNNLTDKPSINGVTIEGTQVASHYDLATVTELNGKVNKSGDFMSGPLSFDDFSISSGDGMAKIEGTEYGLRVDTTSGLGAALLTVGGIGEILTSLDLKNTYSPTGTDPVTGKAVASAISTKQDTITGAATTITQNNLTANKALISNNDGKVAVSNVTATELGYVSGVTSAIQTQITNEVNARVGGDNNLQGQIDALAASSDVTDIVGTYAELQAYDTSKLKDNDIIKVLSDSTHEGASTYYRWSTHTNTFTYIGLEGPYYTKAEADSEFLSQTNAASTYLSQADAASTYLTQANAASTYATQSSLTSGLAGKQDTLTTAQLAAVNSGVTSSTVSQVQTNKQDIEAIEEELEVPWQKPEQWVDIRNGALQGSIYFLVGHSADYQTYPEFYVSATVNNSGSYDVFVDGVKVATTAGGTATTLNWQTLALTSGWDVTYPTSLRTHIVRVSPSVRSNSINQIATSANGDTVQRGTLWAHFETQTKLNLNTLFYNTSRLLEAVTCGGEALQTSGLNLGFYYCSSLKYVCPIDCNNTASFNSNSIFYKCGLLKKVTLKNYRGDGQRSAKSGAFFECTSLKQIEFINGAIQPDYNQFINCVSLKNLPPFCDYQSTANPYYITNFLRNCKSLGPTYLDFSYLTKMTRFTCGNADSTEFVGGLKGLTVCNEAPFNNATSPQLDVAYTGLDRTALVSLFKSMPTVTDSQVCNITGCTGAASLTSDDLAIATAKGWTVTR